MSIKINKKRKEPTNNDIRLDDTINKKNKHSKDPKKENAYKNDSINVDEFIFCDTIKPINVNEFTFCDTIKPISKNGKYFHKDGVYFLDNENCLIIKENVLDIKEFEDYLISACNVLRVSEKVGWNFTPRYEVCYTVDGKPYRYSGKDKYTIKFPQYILDIIPKFLDTVNTMLLPKKNIFTKLSNGVDILYHSHLKGGGSIARHKDDEMPWGLVIIYSIGQTRYLKIREDKTGKIHIVKMTNNSLVCMHGETFQQLFTHQMDKLKNDEIAYHRLSLNVRFLKEDENNK